MLKVGKEIRACGDKEIGEIRGWLNGGMGEWFERLNGVKSWKGN